MFIAGSCAGSFLGALTWRMPRKISISAGRSRCFSCGHGIRWYDNIPIISYLLLKGRCRDCKKPIPRRDFIIEFSASLLFPLFYYLMPHIKTNLPWLGGIGDLLALVLILFIVSMCIVVFVVDYEHQYIPDFASFLIILSAVCVLLISDYRLIYVNILSGLGAALFLLLINLTTLGRGMGLGDVKLALAFGLVGSYPLTIVFMFLSFTLGALVGLILIALKLTKLKAKIAFGPFLVAAFFVTLVKGYDILNLFFYV